MGSLHVKRIYDAPENNDGRRVLVDRIWPRGVSKASAKVDLWLKDIAPSTELRRWFGHDPERFKEFRSRYGKELAANPDTVSELRHLADQVDVTLLYAAHDREVNHAIVLADYLRSISKMSTSR